MSVFNVPLDIVRCVFLPMLTFADLGNLSAVCKDWRAYLLKKYAKEISLKLGCNDLARESKMTIFELLQLWQNAGSPLACGESHAAMISKDGTVLKWSEFATRTRVQLPRVRAHSVSCGDNHTVIVTSEGTVFVQGSNSHGQLGLGDRTDRPFPVILALPFKVSLCRAGGKYTLFVSKNSNGLYFAGQLNATVPVAASTALVPTEMPFKCRKDGERIVQIAAGTMHILVLTDHQRLLSAGASERFRLGRSVSEEQPAAELHDVAFADRPEATAIVQIAAGTTHSLVLFANGAVFTFGQSLSGELGLPGYRDAIIAQIIPNLPKAIAVSAGSHHSLILTAETNKIVAFGMGALGQLGYRSSFWSSTFPQQSPLPRDEDKRIKFVAAGSGFSACLSGDCEDLFTCGRSSLCAGAGLGVKNGTVLTIFSRVPDIA
jgi:alpha-tubulin suppressor-like RCC1 family protein